MKYLFSILLVLLLAFPALAEEWFDYGSDWCLETSTQEYCLEFVATPFGPSLNMGVTLIVTPLDQVFGPIEREFIPFGTARQSRPGEFVFFSELPDWFGLAEENRFSLFQEPLEFSRKIRR